MTPSCSFSQPSPDVHLEHLELDSTQVNMPFILENLALVHSVTRICFSGVYPKNLRERDWPCSLAHLKRISFSNFFLPQELLGYPQLQELFIKMSNHKLANIENHQEDHAKLQPAVSSEFLLSVSWLLSATCTLTA